jgi:flagellar M-ring protein FliF
MAAKNLDGQLSRLRSSFTNGQLAIVGVLSVIGIVATLAFLRWVSQPSYRPLVTGASAAEARETTESLQKDGIAYKLTDNGTTVMVRSADVGKARLTTGTSTGATSNVVGLELFDSQSFTTSDFQQRVGYQRALQGELTRSLLTIQGITSASVQHAMPPERLFAKDQKPTQASVLIGSDGAISSSTVKSIVQLVSSAVPGLEPEKVTVTNTRGQVLTDNGTATGDSNSERATQYELGLAAKAESMLAQVYGQGRVVVRVAAAMNFDTKNTETTTYSTPDKAVPVRQSETTETFKGNGTPPGGAIGVEGQVADSGANDYTHTEKSNESVVSSTVEKSSTAPGTLQRLTAAAIVDEALDPAPDPAQIERLIAAAIGIDTKRGDSVEVQTMKMPTEEEAVSAAREELVEKAAMPITDYARIGIGAIVLLIVLFVLRRGLRTTSEVIDLTNERVPAHSNGAASRGANGTPSELRLIDAEPAELANILRSWAGDRREAPRP